ncbi:glycosyltransferase family 39 protein [Myxococcota bacterium]
MGASDRIGWREVRAWGQANAPPQDGWKAACVGLLVRLGVVIWAAERFPPAADGSFYHIVAERISRGLGYTWLWPDGAVTFAAHYPVGYPALVGAWYWILGPKPWVAMLLGAVLGSLAIVAVHRMAARETGRAGALLAAILVALHPTLVFYTAALMTEGLVAALLSGLGWLTLSVRARVDRRWAWMAGLGLATGLTALVRPQILLLAPLLGALAVKSPGIRSHPWRHRLLAAGLTSGLALAACLPWTLRNCSRMDRCVLVSANGGWNLLIGSGPAATGSWVPIEKMLPAECRTVYAEVAKDDCFGRAAWRHMADRPWHWVGLIPRKLAATFNATHAASGYLGQSNALAWPGRAQAGLSACEIIWQRVIVALGLVALARARGPHHSGRRVIGVLAGLGLLQVAAWPSYLAVVVMALLLGKELADRPVLGLAAGALAATALTHAAFFGAGRYALVCVGVLSALAGLAFGPKAPERTR